jgi:hypothetical protein
MMTRITESLLTHKVKSIYDMEGKSMINKKECDNLVQRLESNINARGVRGGHFKFLFEAGKNKLEQVSLNKTSAQLISAPPAFFKTLSCPNHCPQVYSRLFSCHHQKLPNSSVNLCCGNTTSTCMRLIECNLLQYL